MDTNLKDLNSNNWQKGSNSDSPHRYSAPGLASAQPQNDINTSTATSHRIATSPTVSDNVKHPEYFPSSRYLAQADPDYHRAPTGVSRGNGDNLAATDIPNTELFRPTLRAKSRQGASSSQKRDNFISQVQSSGLSKPKTSPVLVDSAGKHTSRKTKANEGEEAKRPYNEGYRDRMRAVENSKLFFRIPLDGADTVSMLQNLYSKISVFEKKQAADLDKLVNSTPESPFDEEVWDNFARQQVQLVERYSDFLYYATLPSEKAVLTKGFIRKYKITTRLWNNGISVFVDVLRSRSPSSNKVLASFVIHCMNILMLCIDPVFDARHIWIESLGDLALVCLMSNVRACANWREMCLYWYQRRALLTPGTGRLYRHMATISDWHVDSLFYICKSLTAVQSMPVPTSDILSMLNNTIVSGNSSKIQTKALITESKSIITLMEMHLHCINCPPPDSELRLDPALAQDIQSCDSIVINHGAAIAFCNITALLKYGDSSCTLFNYFKQTNKKRWTSSSGANKDSTDQLDDGTAKNEEGEIVFPTPGSEEIISLKSAKAIAKYILDSFIYTTDFSVGLQHVIVWTYFLLAAAKAPSHIRDCYIDKDFPFKSIVEYLNNICSIHDNKRYYSSQEVILVHSTPRIGPEPDQPVPEERFQHFLNLTPENERPNMDNFPSLFERPLPEEVHIRGFVWYNLIPNFSYLNKEVSPLDEPYVAHYGAAYLTKIRVKRLRVLGRELTLRTPWIKYDSNSNLFYVS